MITCMLAPAANASFRMAGAEFLQNSGTHGMPMPQKHLLG